MKTAVVSVIVVALAGGTWTWIAPHRDVDAPKKTSAFEAEERVGLKRMLVARDDLEFANLVIGSNDGTLRDFRARLIEDGNARPVFGQARRICESAPDLPECWELAHLQVNGQSRNLSASDVARAAIQDGPLEDDNQDAEIETGDTAPAEMIAPIEPKATDAPGATHLVARPIINARSGPGIANPVLFKLSQGARLGLISEDRGWGKFVILDGENQGSEAWASLSILESLQ